MSDYYVTATPQPSRFSRKTLIIGGGGLVAIIIAVALLLGSGGNGLSTQLQHLSLRISTLQSLLENNTDTANIHSENLDQLVTDLDLTLTSNKNQLAPIMTADGMPSNFDKNIITSETDTSTATKLNDANLNNEFDQAYAQVLGEKITSLRALVAETYAMAKDVKLRQVLTSLDNNLDDSQKRLNALNL